MSDVALRFGAKDDGLNAQFRKVNSDLDKFSSHAKSVGSAISSSFKAIAGIAAAVGVAKLASESLEFADAQKKMSVQTGLTVEATQRLSYIAGQTSVEVGTLTNGVLKLQRVLGGFEEGSEKSADALNRLGLANSAFRSMRPEDQFDAVARAVSGLTTQNEKVVAVTELFGKSGAELIPVLDAMGKESADYQARLDAIGGPVGKKAIDQVDDLGDAFSTTGLAAKSLTTELLAMVAPPVIWGLEQIQKVLGGIRVLAGGGSNESANLDRQIEQLEKSMKLELSQTVWLGAHADRMREQIRARYKPLIEEVKRQQRELLQLEEYSPTVAPKIAAPGSASYEETDDQRDKRLKEESEARAQRLKHIATLHLIEQEMAVRNSVELTKIDQARLDELVARETDATIRRTRIQSDAQIFLADVRKTFGLQEIKFEEIKDQSIIEIASNMFSVLARENTKLAKIQQGIALAQTIWSTASAIMKAFETLPWPANLQAAAKVAITGAIQVAKIKSTNYSAGSVSGSAATLSGGSSVGAARDTSTQDVPDVTGAQGATTVYMSGMITRDIVDYMIEGLREGFDRDVILIPSGSLQAQVIRGDS